MKKFCLVSIFLVIPALLMNLRAVHSLRDQVDLCVDQLRECNIERMARADAMALVSKDSWYIISWTTVSDTLDIRGTNVLVNLADSALYPPHRFGSGIVRGEFDPEYAVMSKLYGKKVRFTVAESPTDPTKLIGGLVEMQLLE